MALLFVTSKQLCAPVAFIGHSKFLCFEGRWLLTLYLVLFFKIREKFELDLWFLHMIDSALEVSIFNISYKLLREKRIEEIFCGI